MSQERTEQKHFFETKEAVGTKIWALDSGIGEIIEMQAPYSYRMHNGVHWESEKIVDQYLDYGGVEGVGLKSIFPMEEAVRQLIGLLDQSRSETQAADRASEMNMWMIDRLNAVIKEQSEYIDAINKASDGLDTAVYLHMCHIEKQNLEMLHLEALEQNACEKEFAMKFVVQDRDIAIWERDETIRDLTAKVQERDVQNNNLKWQVEVAKQAAKIEIEDRDKEIERLREVVKNEIIEKSQAAIGHKHALEERDKEIEREFGKKGGLANMEDGINGLREEIERLRAALDEANSRFSYIESSTDSWDICNKAIEGSKEIVAVLKGAE